MSTLNQLISEISHAVGQPNNVPLRRNIRQSIIHIRNELIRKGYSNNKYADKDLQQKFKIEIIDVPDGDIYGMDNTLVPSIKRSKNKVPKPTRLINGMPFLSVRTFGMNNFNLSFAKESTAQFYHNLSGFCQIPVYDYINGYIYIFGKSNLFKDIQYINIESIFEYPHLIKEETVESQADYLEDNEDLDDDEFLLPEDMIGDIKDIIFKRNLLNIPRETNETPLNNLVK